MSVVGAGLRAGLVAAVLSGVPSTVHALVTGRDALAASRAAGGMVLPRETRTLPLLLAAVPVHLGLSLGWGVVLAQVLPRRRTAAWGALAGLAIAAVDLNVPGPRTARVRELATWPQVADHVAFGMTVGAVLSFH